MEGSTSTPPLSLVIATTAGWPTVRQAFAPVRQQAERSGAEILLIDGSGGRQPEARELGPSATWIEMPGADIAEMRMAGYRRARGEILAMTEDHVEAAPDWFEAILRAHAEQPGAAAVGGSVRNGTPRHRVDWASFYAGHAPFLAPLANGPAEYLSGINVSYKRGPLLAALDRLGGGRAIETLINEQIKAVGGVLWADDRLVVTHFQSRGVRGTTRLHFYAGRHFEGTRRESSQAGAARALRAVALPMPRAVKRLATAMRRGEPPARIASAAPAMLLIMSAQAAGEVAGILRGPGRAAAKLH